MTNGAEVEQVDEPLSGPCTVVEFELEAYPEPKCLSPTQLQALYGQYENYPEVAKLIGASEAFVRQNATQSRKRLNRGKRTSEASS